MPGQHSLHDGPHMPSQSFEQSGEYDPQVPSHLSVATLPHTVPQHGPRGSFHGDQRVV